MTAARELDGKDRPILNYHPVEIDLMMTCRRTLEERKESVARRHKA